MLIFSSDLPNNNKQKVVYEGVLRKALKHGKGKRLYSTYGRSASMFGGSVVACDVHIGLWRNGEKDGKGRYESHHDQTCDDLTYSYDGNSYLLEGSWNNGEKDGEYIHQFFGSKTFYKKIYNQGKFVSSNRMNGNILNDISHAIGNVASNASSDSSSSSNNCTEIKETCRANCKPMSGSASFWSNTYKRNCNSKCSDAYYSCKRGNMKEMRKNICKSQCVTKEGGSVLDLKSSERTKCFRGCN